MLDLVGKNGEQGDYSHKILEKQKILRDLIKSLGWSVRKFRALYCTEIQEFDDESAHKACMEKIKKQITTVQKSYKTLIALEKYICFVENSEDFKKKGNIKLQAITDSILHDSIREELLIISKNIDKIIKI